MIDFTHYTNPLYRSAWFHRRLCEILDIFLRGGPRPDNGKPLTRLLVIMPPQHGKSELVSRRLPAMALGLNPHEKILTASYNSGLAADMNRDVQRIIDSPEYHRLFPRTTLDGSGFAPKVSGSWARNSEHFDIVGARGYYKCAGVGGGLTGKTATMGIIDDPFKDWQDAWSPTVRSAILDWYATVFYTRLSKGARLCVMHTRWHEEDLCGHLMQQMVSDPNADQWYVLDFPAILDRDPCRDDIRCEGEPLWEEEYTRERYQTIKSSIGSDKFAALYQGRPTPKGGGIWKRHWWRFWHFPGDPRPPVRVRTEEGEFVECPCVELPHVWDDKIQSWDMAFKAAAGNSYVAGHLWGRERARFFLIDRIFDHLGFTDTVKAVQAFSAAHPDALAKLIEGKANGVAVIDTLKGKIAGLVEVDPGSDTKVVRAMAVSPTIEAGDVFLPHPSIYPWVNDVLTYFEQFPRGASSDDVDASSQALNYLTKRVNVGQDDGFISAGRSKWVR